MPHIQYRKGSIFDADTQVIVNAVNCKGVMGAFPLSIAPQRRGKHVCYAYL